MPCASPLEAYQPAAGGPVVFSRPRARAHNRIEIPCGQCILCRLEHARQWAVRITHEASLHEESAFITLTYDDEHLPNYNSLQYSDLQLFWKRLRRGGQQLRYYAVGEYGETTHRPHYHACIFGQAFTEDRQILRDQPSMLWTNPRLTEAWGKGHVSVGALTFQTAQYTASYVTKKLNNKRRYVRVDQETGELQPMVQPRAFMSLKPAIGREWLNHYGKHVYEHDQVVIQGRPQKPPKYYDRWLEISHPEQHLKIKEERKNSATTYTPKQNRARALNAHARIKQGGSKRRI